MKVLFVSAENIYLTPYITSYIKILDKLEVEYKIIYWDKNDNEVYDDIKYIRFFDKSKDVMGKLLAYAKFGRVIKKELRSTEYLAIVPLHTVIAFVISRILLNDFGHRFIYDVRDYSYEKFWIYRKVQKKLVENSMINIISSSGYKFFLPDSEYYLMSNVPKYDYSSYKQLKNRERNTFNLGYIGLIRFMDQNKKIISHFANDSRFNLYFVGTNALQLKEFCQENNIHNVILIDTFEESKTLEYYQDIDLVMNLYGNNTPLLDYALSNKLYLAAGLYKPILVCEGTYMEEVSKQYDIGYTLRLTSPTEKDELYDYMIRLNRPEFIERCDKFMTQVYKEQSLVLDKLCEIFSRLKECE